jgi:hypothetical protein
MVPHSNAYLPILNSPEKVPGTYTLAYFVQALVTKKKVFKALKKRNKTDSQKNYYEKIIVILHGLLIGSLPPVPVTFVPMAFLRMAFSFAPT